MEMDTTIQNQSPIETSQNQPPQGNIDKQKGFFQVVIGVIVLLLVVAGGAYYLGTQQYKPSSNSQSSPSVASITNIQQSSSPTPTKNDNSSDQITTRQIVDLYELELYTPTGWNIQEVNRRSEPVGPGAIHGHDCADYKIMSNDGYATLSLLPTCGFADGGADLWPSDSSIVKDLGGNSWIIRFFDSSKGVYRYASASQAQISDEKGTRMERTHSSPPIITSGEGQGLTFIVAELSYTGSQSSKNDYLQKADNIIASIKHL